MSILTFFFLPTSDTKDICHTITQKQIPMRGWSELVRPHGSVQFYDTRLDPRRNKDLSTSHWANLPPLLQHPQLTVQGSTGESYHCLWVCCSVTDANTGDCTGV